MTAGAAAAGAADSIVTNTRSPDRMINVEARYLAPAPCYRIAVPQPVRASGGAAPETVLRYRLVVARKPGECAGTGRLVRRGFIAFMQPQTLALELTFVTPAGRVLKRERFGIIGE